MSENTGRLRVWGKPIEQMDVWLDSQGFYRKHTARDSSCLFRAVSEQVFMTQVHHSEIRKQVVKFQMNNYDHFQKLVKSPLEEYSEKMRDSREYGGKVEIEAMAMLYKHDFEMFKEVCQPAERITKFGFNKKVILCYSQDKHYDSVYTKERISLTAFCQSTVYEALYKRVFELKEVDYAIRKMLYEKTSRSQREHVPFMSTEFALRLEMRENYTNAKDLLDYGITPFPYKVAKSLDPEMYRNVEYDAWNEYRKGLRYGFFAWTCNELQVGVKCLVKDGNRQHTGHIQEMSPNKGPVVVFIEELGEMHKVPYESLELLPQPSQVNISSPKIMFPFKLPLLQLQDDNGTKAKKILKNLLLRQKIKEAVNTQLKQESQEIKNKAKEEETQNPTVSSTNYYEEDDRSYQGEENNVYVPQAIGQQPEQEENQHPDSTKDQNVMVPIDYGYRYMYTNTAPTMSVQMPEMPLPAPAYPTPIPVNLMAKKSLNMDGSDLPHSDVSTLRFFYNLGIDHMRMNVQWNIAPGNTFYINNAPQPNYLIENQPQPVYEQTYIQTIAPGPVRTREVIQSPITEEIQSTQRFRNKKLQIKREVYEVPPGHQCEVTSTTNVPITPTYYPQVEYDPPCCVVPYVDYNVYEYQQQAYTPSYITPEGLVYQTIMPSSSL